MAPEIEKVVNSRMDIWKSLRLQSRFEPAQSSLANSSRLMRQFHSIIGSLRCVMNRLGSQLPMGDTTAGSESKASSAIHIISSEAGLSNRRFNDRVLYINTV